jgi:hypothetical protein
MKIRPFPMAWLAGSLLLALGCPQGVDEVGADDEAETDTSTDTQTDTSTQTGTDTETGTTTGTQTDTSTDTETDTTESSSSDTADTGVLECECIIDQPEDDPPDLPTCGDALCDTAELIDDPEFPDESIPLIVNPEAVDCALMALRDRTPGFVQWYALTSYGMDKDRGYVLIYEDGVEGVHRDWYTHDLDYFASPARRFELLPPDHYDSCLAYPDSVSRYGCLIAEPQAELEICDEGWAHSI